MDIKEIVNRPDSIPIQEKEAYFVIREYVKARKGVEIDPEIDLSFGSISAIREIHLMHSMLNSAISWYRQNPDQL